MVVLMAILGIVVAAAAFLTGYALWSGFVLSILWGWFLVPLGVPAIGTAHAIGIAVVMGMFHRNNAKRDDEGFAYIGLALIGPLLALGVGYTAKGFM